MELDVSKAFLSPATAFPFEAKVALTPQEVGGETITFDEVVLRGAYSAYDDVIRLEGTLETVAHGACALCMQPAESPLNITFEETFRKDANEIEDEYFRFEGKSVPLDHMTLTLVMLNLPMRFECVEGCEGSDDLKAWKKANPVSSDDIGAPTQHPFEALQSLLNDEPEQ